MKDINQFLSDLLNGSTHIISSPKTIKELLIQGAKFDMPANKTTEELINELFEARKKQILELKIYEKFPEAPQIPVPTIVSLYNEIKECIMFGLNGAAISQSAVLVEFALKNAIVRYHYGHTYSKEEWDRVENMEMSETINEAKALGILNPIWIKVLEDFRDDVRNPYLHYNIKTITKKVVAGKTKRTNLKTGQTTEENILAEDNPIVWTLAKKFVDKEYVLHAFCFADALVKYLYMKSMSFEDLVEHIENTLGIKYVEKNKDQASHPLHLFVDEKTKEKFILKSVKEDDLEIPVYIEYLPKIKNEFKALVLPESVAAFNTKEYVYILSPYYEGERFDFNTNDINLADDLVNLVLDLSTIDVESVVKGGKEFDYDGFEKNFWQYISKAILLGLINETDAQKIKSNCAKVLAQGKDNQKMVISNGDFNPRNVIRFSDGKLVLIDWNGITSPLEHMLTYPWLLNWQNLTWQKEYASKFESKLPVDKNRLRMHLMNIALIRGVDEKGHGNTYADTMSQNHMKNFYASLDGFKSLVDLCG